MVYLYHLEMMAELEKQLITQQMVYLEEGEGQVVRVVMVLSEHL